MAVPRFRLRPAHRAPAPFKVQPARPRTLRAACEGARMVHSHRCDDFEPASSARRKRAGRRAGSATWHALRMPLLGRRSGAEAAEHLILLLPQHVAAALGDDVPARPHRRPSNAAPGCEPVEDDRKVDSSGGDPHKKRLAPARGAALSDLSSRRPDFVTDASSHLH